MIFIHLPTCKNINFVAVLHVQHWVQSKMYVHLVMQVYILYAM